MSDEAWRAAIDERLIARCQQHERKSERLKRDWSMPVKVRVPRLHLDPDEWRTGFLRADREREIPMQLTADLDENMPQALLRDLYRPVREDRWVERELVEGTGDRGGFGAIREAREARQPHALPRIESLLGAVRELQAWRRTFLGQHWQPFKKDDEPR